MNYQNKTKDQLIKDIKELQHNHNSLKESYEKALSENLFEKDKLQQQIQNSYAMFESSPVAMFVIDDTTNIVMTNLAFAVMCGGSESEILQHRPGNALRCVHSPIDPRGCGYATACKYCKVRNGVESLIANGGSLHGAELELELIRNEEPGKYWVNIGVEPMMMNGHRHWCIAMDDVTERKNAEAMFQNIIDMNPMSIQIVDMEGLTKIANKAYISLFGAVPPSDFSIFNDLQSKGVGELVLLAKKGEVVHFPDMYYNVHDVFSNLPDKPVWIRAILFPLKDSNDTSKLLAFMHEDITERKQIEEAFARSRQLLSEAEGIGKVGGWEFNIDTMKQTWTDELYRLHEVDLDAPAKLTTLRRFILTTLRRSKLTT
jgi:PAS domain-containing protein